MVTSFNFMTFIFDKTIHTQFSVFTITLGITTKVDASPLVRITIVEENRFIDLVCVGKWVGYTSTTSIMLLKNTCE
jgi:hypothetical protein